MDFATMGFMRADRYRLGVLEATKSKVTKNELAGRLRMPLPLVERTLSELKEKGLISAEKEAFAITEKGLKILAQISKPRI